MKASELKALAVLAVLTLSALTGCGDGNSSSTLSAVSGGGEAAVSNVPALESQPQNEKKNDDTKTKTTQPAEPTDGPVLKLGDVTASPGETVEIPLSVTGTGEGWSLCGLHITYPDDLKPVIVDPKEHEVKYDLGSAAKGGLADWCLEWAENKTDYLEDNGLGCIFYTQMFNENGGSDGEIAKFYFEVPLNAKSGTVYPLEFYYRDTDVFLDKTQNTAYQMLAFNNWQSGSLTIK